MRPLLFAALPALLMASAAPARAQRIEATATASRVTYRFTDFTGYGEQSGSYVGAVVGVEASQVRVALRGLFGTLTDPTGSDPDRDVRITGLTLGMVMAPWLEVGVDAQARRAVAGVDTTVVRLGGVYGRALTELGGNGLTGSARLAWYPVNDVVNLDPVSVALEAEVGVRYTPPRSPLSVAAAYRLTRLDYNSSGGFRPALEQDQQLLLQVALHAGR